MFIYILLDENIKTQFVGGLIVFVLIVLEITLKPVRKLFRNLYKTDGIYVTGGQPESQYPGF